MAAPRAWKLFVVGWALIEVMLFSGLIYGWPSLLYVLKEEGFFEGLCKADDKVVNCTRNGDLLNTSVANTARTIGYLGCNISSTFNYSTQSNVNIGELNVSDVQLFDAISSEADDTTSGRRHRLELSAVGVPLTTISYQGQGQIQKDSGHKIHNFCATQEEMLNLVFTVASFSEVLSPVSGYIYDKWGSTRSRIIAMTSIVIGSLMMAFSYPGIDWVLFPATILMNAGGIIVYLTSFQVLPIFPRFSSTIAALLSGGYDNSAYSFLLIKLAYDAGISFQESFIFLAVLGAFVFGVTTLILPPKMKKQNGTPHDSFKKSRKNIFKRLRYLTVRYETGKDECQSKEQNKVQLSSAPLVLSISSEKVNGKRSGSSAAVKTEGDLVSDIQKYHGTEPKKENGTLLNKEARVSQSTDPENMCQKTLHNERDNTCGNEISEEHSESSSSTQDSNSTSMQNDICKPESIHEAQTVTENITLLLKEAENDTKDEVTENPTKCNCKSSFSRIFFSPSVMLLLLWISCSCLVIMVYIGIFNTWIGELANDDHEKVSHYTNVLGWLQLAGVMFGPLAGYLIDWKRGRKDDTGGNLSRYLPSFIITDVCALLLVVFMAIPVLEVQYSSMVVHGMLKNFAFAVHAAYLSDVVRADHFGKVYTIHISVLTTLTILQFPLFSWYQGPLKKNLVPLNIVLLCTVLITVIQPVYIWWHSRRQGAPQEDGPDTA